MPYKDEEMEYVELRCKLDPLEPWREILIAQLADYGFESFEETFDGFRAYVQARLFDEGQLSDALKLPGSKVNPLKSIAMTSIGPKNWNQVWEQAFDPVSVDDRVYIRAPFHQANTGAELEIVIEPKMSFGTGHHETTRLIIQFLLEMDMADKKVLDMGCGTGILAVMAEKKGASDILAIDNYAVACENTRDNLLRNHCLKVRVKHGDATLLGNEQFDVILANITRNVLLEDMAKYFSVLRPGGVLLMSGFLIDDRELIKKQAEKFGLVLAGEKLMEDWVGLMMRKCA